MCIMSYQVIMLGFKAFIMLILPFYFAPMNFLFFFHDE